MTLFILKRFATFVATLLAASVLVFAVLDVLPGNAAELMLGESATPESLKALSAKLGLDQPPLTRYAVWIKGLAHGDMGTSLSYDTPVLELVTQRLAVTLPLALMAMALTTVLALALGIYAASHHNRIGDVGVMGLSQLGIAIPNFWFAILLILLFAVKLQWFSAGGFPGWTEDDGGGAWEGFKALVLPAVALAVVQAAILARITRSAVLDVLREDFVRTARAKGLSQLGIAIPNFWFAILLILLFAVKLRWFSAGGFPGWTEDDGGGPWEGFKALVLPAVALAVVQAAILARITRSAVLDVLREDFVRTARAKGLSQRQVLWRHVLRNAFVPVLTVMGLQFASLLAGTVVIEYVFSLPGLGRLVFQAIANRDLVVVRNVVLLLAAAVILVNFVVDVLYAVVDPRLRLSDGVSA